MLFGGGKEKENNERNRKKNTFSWERERETYWNKIIIFLKSVKIIKNVCLYS